MHEIENKRWEFFVFADIHYDKNMDCPSIIKPCSGNQTKVFIFYSVLSRITQLYPSQLTDICCSLISKFQVSQMLPEKFAEQHIRLYSKLRDKDSIYKANLCFKKWCEMRRTKAKVLNQAFFC